MSRCITTGDALYIMDQVTDNKKLDDGWLDEIGVKEAMSRLNDREKHPEAAVLRGPHPDGGGGEIGISQAQVSRLEKNALSHMRKHVGMNPGETAACARDKRGRGFSLCRGPFGRGKLQAFPRRRGMYNGGSEEAVSERNTKEEASWERLSERPFIRYRAALKKRLWLPQGSPGRGAGSARHGGAYRPV